MSKSQEAPSVYRPGEAGVKLYGRVFGRAGANGIYHIGKEGFAQGFAPMIEQNPIDFLDVSLLNGPDVPTRPSDSGWFSDEISFNPQRLLPRDGRSCRSDFGSSSVAVPASFSQFLCTEVGESRSDGSSGMPPAPSERLNRHSAGFVRLVGRCGPARSTARS